MAIIDVVKYQFQEGEVVHRFPSESFEMGNKSSSLSRTISILCQRWTNLR